MARQFETESCGRCGGSGTYSYCQRYGTTCFGCMGARVVLTKRGAAAKAFFEASCSKRADQFKVGEVIKLSSGVFATITAIGTSDDCKWLDKETGVWKSHFTIETNKMGLHTFPHVLYRQGQSNEVKAAKLAAALEYQGTLAKSGKPLKRKTA